MSTNLYSRPATGDTLIGAANGAVRNALMEVFGSYPILLDREMGHLQKLQAMKAAAVDDAKPAYQQIIDLLQVHGEIELLRL